MNFTKLNISDFKIYQDFFQSSDLYQNYYGSELNFPVLYVWQNFQNVKNYITENYIVIRAGENFFAPPLTKTKNDFIKAITGIKEYCVKLNMEPKLCYLNENMKNIIADNFDCSDPVLDRDMSEYIYNVSDLINFEGKKYHAKKNHLNQFENYSYSIKKYDESYFNSVMEILELWGNTHQNITAENDAIIMSLKNYKQLNIICDLVFVEDKISGFAIGCVCNNNLGMILFEKADIKYRGIYVKINNSFVKENFSNLQYASLQEDMGDEGLRKSKMSYHPAFLEHKYTLILK